MTPPFEIRRTPNLGTHYVTHTLYVGGKAIRSQLGPMSEEQIEQAIADYLNPPKAPPVRPFASYGRYGSKPGRPQAQRLAPAGRDRPRQRMG